MNTKKSIYIWLATIFAVLSSVTAFSTKIKASSTDSYPNYGKTFYEDVPEATNNPLGASGYFHIFANKANLRNHTAGNIATRELSGNSNFGNPNSKNGEYNYIQNFREFNSASGGSSNGKIVFGKEISIGVVNGDRPSIQDKRNDTRVYPLDRYTKNNVCQDKNELPEYINFDKEFSDLTNLSKKIIHEPQNINITNAYFKDQNQRVIDVTNITASDIYISLSPEVLKTNTPLTLKGLEKNKNDKNFKNVYIIVNTDSDTDYNILSQIKFSYIDGTNRGNKETTDFSDNTVLWTFSNNGNPYKGNIKISSTWLGSILAPQAKLGGDQNIDGNIIVDSFKGAGETHRWDWQPNNKKYRIQLVKADFENNNILLKGAEFSLYKSDGTLVKDKLITDDNGQLSYIGLEPGAYYFIETRAPNGYELSQKHYNFNIGETNNEHNLIIKALNKRLPAPTVSINGTKTWSDNNNKDQTRPTSITVRLFANGEEVAHKTVTAADDWKYNFSNLPKNDQGGKAITYTVKEDSVKNYKATIDGFNINNTYKPGAPAEPKVAVNGTKTWSDNNNKNQTRPTSITVRLFANGEEVAHKTVTAADDW
ncbi:Cna B-type domain-containing protein, partial [Lactiplantibacillus plantarum]|uniref:Cna B-type domain-containing protein n=1 Tax=Lactiplantibacillus plantarum TaxID=1590 RepID=UPI002A7497DD